MSVSEWECVFISLSLNLTCLSVCPCLSLTTAQTTSLSHSHTTRPLCVRSNHKKTQRLEWFVYWKVFVRFIRLCVCFACFLCFLCLLCLFCRCFFLLLPFFCFLSLFFLGLKLVHDKTHGNGYARWKNWIIYKWLFTLLKKLKKENSKANKRS